METELFNETISNTQNGEEDGKTNVYECKETTIDLGLH